MYATLPSHVCLVVLLYAVIRTGMKHRKVGLLGLVCRTCHSSLVWQPSDAKQRIGAHLHICVCCTLHQPLGTMKQALARVNL